MDLAGVAVAVRRSNGRVVTVAVTAMSFQRPVFVGDEVSLCENPYALAQKVDIAVEAAERIRHEWQALRHNEIKVLG